MSGPGELDLPSTPDGPDARETGPAVGGRRQAAPAARRGAADPVKALLHQHRDLCERAVDALEIAAGLEARGVTDRTAARFRHRDVFSLAEEMYARAPREARAVPPRPADRPADRVTDRPAPMARTRWAFLTVLPGALCAATVAALRLTDGQPRLVAAVAGVLAVLLSLRAVLRRGPLSPAHRGAAGQPRHGTGVWTCWLVGYALLGDGLLAAAVVGGPDGFPTGGTGDTDSPWPLSAAPVLALALGCVPAAWSAHLFAVRARRRVEVSRGLEEFAASVRPLLFGAFVLFLGALAVLVALCGAALGEPAAPAQALTLGALLFLARLLTVHGFRHAPALVLTTAATTEGLALATVFAGRLPGCGFLAVPVDTLFIAWGPSAVPALACGATALTLLIHATQTLTRASAHATPERPC
ncbi:hypothetical protein ABZ354_27205 [Streptomyces sp. NPDC005925]|uniref:hypothetical protein n=1 Tax=Streptomyces sp. NPDC005925 TaxID=3157172 RepID=UPI0033C46B4A